jgi:hypothetical protein
LARPPATVGAALVRRGRTVCVRIAGSDADSSEASRLGFRRTSTRSDGVDLLQILAAASALGVVALVDTINRFIDFMFR